MHCAIQPLGQQANPAQLFQPVGTGQFRRRCGRGGAQIGGEIGDGDVGFVANAGHQRNQAVKDRPRYDFRVERLQIFQRTAAAHHEHHVAIPALSRQPDRAGNAFRRVVALYRHGIEQDRHAGTAAAQGSQHVAERRAGRGGDDADPVREAGQGPLAFRRKQPFPFQLQTQFIVSSTQRSGAGFLDVFDDDLKIAARFVQADPAAH